MISSPRHRSAGLLNLPLVFDRCFKTLKRQDSNLTHGLRMGESIYLFHRISREIGSSIGLSAWPNASVVVIEGHIKNSSSHFFVS